MEFEVEKVVPRRRLVTGTGPEGGQWDQSVVFFLNLHIINFWNTPSNKIHDLGTYIYIYMFGEGNGNPLQYSCLENPVDGGAWWAAVHGVARSQTQPEWLHFPFSLSCIGEGNGNPLPCSCLENPRDGGVWWAAVCGVTQSRTRLKQLGSIYIYVIFFKGFIYYLFDCTKS